MTDRELLQQALDALISVWNSDRTTRQVETIRAIKARLTQVKKEWVGLTDEDLDFWSGELNLGELGKGVLRAVNAHLKEKNT